MSTHQPTEPLVPVDQQPVLGLHGEPCASCGAPLAADQRYCLSCGNRRAGSRLPFRDILAEPVGGATVASAAPAPPRADGGRGGTLAALAGLGVVLLALGMGVLIGHAGQGDSPADTTPQVINLGGAATPPAAALGAAAGAAAGAGAAKTSKGAATKKAPGSAPATTKAKNTKLKSLDNLSPEQYQKQSGKLPKTVGTGGAPPPKDNKPAAGGGDFETIG